MLLNTIIPMPIFMDSGPSGPIPIPVAFVMVALVAVMALGSIIGGLAMLKTAIIDEDEWSWRTMVSFGGLLILLLGIMMGMMTFYLGADLAACIKAGKSVVNG